jgi:hypothetical protein
MTIKLVMEVLEDLSCGGVGAEGPTIEEMFQYTEATGMSYDNDADYHTVQYAWRLLEKLHRDVGTAFCTDGSDKAAAAKMMEVLG